MNHESRIMNRRNGFTIVETLVAIAILVVAIIGAMSAVQSGISSYVYSKDQITVFYLAQEGFEQIRNVRDENRLNGRNWLANIAAGSGDPCTFGQACIVSPIESNIPTRCSAPGSCPFLHQDTATGFFTYNNSWPATIYRREIQLSSINADEIAITVTVNWSKGLITRQFKARENLLNW